MPMLDETAVRDRYQQFAGTAQELLSNFREVDENFRKLDRQLRETRNIQVTMELDAVSPTIRLSLERHCTRR
jgi:hypothetical protein